MGAFPQEASRFSSLEKWCEALFEKIGCRKLAVILEKPEIDENLPTPLSWDAKLLSTGKPIESSDFLKNRFRSHIKRGFWKVSAHVVESTPQDFSQTCPEKDEKIMKIMKNRKSQNRSGNIREASLGFRKSFLMVPNEFG